MDTCSDCGERATCEYDWGTGLRKGCPAHDPLRPQGAGMARVPPWYRTLPGFLVQMTTGHLGVCTCGPWNSVTDPPPCPAHGQVRMLQVTC